MLMPQARASLPNRIRSSRVCMDGMRVSTVVALCVCGLVAGTFAEVAYSRLSLRSRSSGSPTYGFAGVAGLRSMRTEDDTMCSCVNRTHSDESSQRTMPTPAVTETCAQPAQHRAPDLATDATSALTRLYSHNSSLSATGGSQVRVCMIVRTFAGHRNKLVALLASVLLWQHAHLTITLVDTGSEAFVDLPLIAELTSAISGRAGSVRISHWRRDAARSRFPQLGDLEDHGYVATDLAMEDVLEDRKAARLAGTPEDELPCNSLIITNGDNLYSFEYLAATLEAMAGGAELVSTHWVSHYDMKKEWILGWGEIQNGHCGPWRPGRDGEVAASPGFIRGCVDLGVVTFKTGLLEETGFRFVINRLREHGTPAAVASSFSAMDAMFYADGNFFRKLYEYLRDNGRVEHAVMIRRALFLHQ